MNKARIASTACLFCFLLGLCLSSKQVIAQSPTRNPVYELKQELQGPNPPATLSTLASSSNQVAGVPNEYLGWSRIAFDSFRDGNFEIYISKWDRPGDLNLSNHPANDLKPRLARASNRIIFYSNRDGDYDIYRMNSDGSNLMQLTSSSGDEFDPAWSPDQSKIVYISDEDDGNQVFLMNADGSGSTQLTFNQGDKADPAWSPDGNQIAYVSYNDQVLGSIWIVNADGSNAHSLIHETPYMQNPVWSPDGTYIGYDADDDLDNWNELIYTNIQSGQTFYLYDPSPHQNPNALVDAWMGTWSPESVSSSLRKWVTFTKVQYTIQEGILYIADTYVERINLDTRVPEKILDSGYDMSPDWQTMDSVAPLSNVSQLPPYSKFSGFDLSWSAHSIGLADLTNFDLDYRFASDQDWFPFTQESKDTQTIAQFENPGETVFFRSRARDQANNLEAWPASDQGDASTTLYTWQLQGLVTDNRGYPFRLIPISANPTPLNSVNTDQDGLYSAYLASEKNLELEVSQPGFGSWPASRVAVNSDQTFDLYLPPKNNLILNGGFEETALEGWEVTGSIRPIRDGTTSHSGTYSARLGKPYKFETINISKTYDLSSLPQIIRNSDGQLYAIWSEAGYPSQMVYSIQSMDESWTDPIPIIDIAGASELMTDSDGTLHLIAFTRTLDGNKFSIVYLTKPIGGEWSPPTTIIGPKLIEYPFLLSPQAAIDSQGTIHLVWSENVGITYTSKPKDASWATPQLILETGSYPVLGIGTDDKIHMIWEELEGSYYDLFYLNKPYGGDWSSPENFTNDQALNFGHQLALGPDDRVHVSWLEDNTMLKYVERLSTGNWSNSTTLYENIPNFPLNQTLMVSPDN